MSKEARSASKMEAADLFPPASILRHTEELILTCEIAEVEEDNQKRFVTVVEMAALLHVGRYEDARHLWRRSRPGVGGRCGLPEDEMAQLDILWNKVAVNMILMKCSLVYQNLEELKALKVQPLATYAMELLWSYRRHLTLLVACTFERIAMPKVQCYWGFANEGAVQDYLQKMHLGWQVVEEESEGGRQRFLLPVPIGTRRGTMMDKTVVMAEKLKSLVDVVTFMEQRRMNV